MKYLNWGFVFLIIGSVVGAGLASGQEIAVFFSSAGKFSYVLIFLVSIFLYLVLKNLMILSKRAKTNNIKEINRILFKNSYKFFDLFLLIGLFIFITANIAGINEIGTIIFKNINFPILSILSIFFSLFIVLLGISAIKKVNLILMPIVIIFIFYVSIKSLFLKDFICSELLSDFCSFKLVFKYICLGLFYVSYNMVFSSSLIFEKSKEFSKKQIKINSFVISISLISLIFIVNLVMLKVSPSTNLPLLYNAFLIDKSLGLIFGFVLWFSILTSLISSLYVLINAFKFNKFVFSCVILTAGFIFSFFGFSKIVSIVYPLQGLIGFIFIIKVFIYNRKNFSDEKCFEKKKRHFSKICGFYINNK